MTTKRRAGTTSRTSEGVDPVAGTHSAGRRRARQDPVARTTAAAAAPDSPDPAELDRRDRRKSTRRKAPGPDKQPTAQARPTAPPADSPPPSDPA